MTRKAIAVASGILVTVFVIVFVVATAPKGVDWPKLLLVSVASGALVTAGAFLVLSSNSATGHYGFGVVIGIVLFILASWMVFPIVVDGGIQDWWLNSVEPRHLNDPPKITGLGEKTLPGVGKYNVYKVDSSGATTCQFTVSKTTANTGFGIPVGAVGGIVWEADGYVGDLK